MSLGREFELVFRHGFPERHAETRAEVPALPPYTVRSDR
jgi:hypothetical protein